MSDISENARNAPGSEALLGDLGLVADDPAPTPASPARFPDGGAYRIEIPSVEGPGPLEAVVEAAAERALILHRVSQGSGAMLLADAEITSMVATCAQADIELCLFLGPRAAWDIGGGRASLSGTGGGRARGAAQLRHSLADAERAVALGVRCLLVADEGVLWALHLLRARGDLPAELTLKTSAVSAPLNPASFAIFERLGADSINVLADLTVAQLAELRAAGSASIDFYVEAPDDLGGFVRHYEAPEVVRVAAPVYLKFGLRNAPDLYPSGEHLGEVAAAMARERVRRAAICLALWERAGDPLPASPAGARTPPEGLVRFEAPAPEPAVAGG